MIWLWVLLPTVLFVLAAWLFVVSMDDFEERWLGAALLAMIVGFASLVPTIRQINHNIDSRACRQFGENSGREVAYFDNTFLDYGCYVRTELGWVPRTDISEVELRTP
jgi:hypothetical protein